MDKLLLKNRILLILVIVLALLNIATIATIVWQSKKMTSFNRPPFGLGAKPFGYKNFQEYVIRELQLNPQQAQAYRAADSIFREKSRLVFSNMQQIRKQMVEEVLKDNPDTVRLNYLSKQLAMEHIDLKSGTFEFLLTLKRICTPAQQSLLREHIRKMFEYEVMGFGAGKGGRKWKDHRFEHERGPHNRPADEGNVPPHGQRVPPPMD